MIIHSDERLRKCNQCCLAFGRADTLRKHVKTHSGKMNPKNCDFTSNTAVLFAFIGKIRSKVSIEECHFRKHLKRKIYAFGKHVIFVCLQHGTSFSVGKFIGANKWGVHHYYHYTT